MSARPVTVHRFNSALLLAAALPALAAAQSTEEGSTLMLCNLGATATIHVAVVEFAPMLRLIGRHEWAGEGWRAVKPNSCRLLLEEMHAESTFWFRMTVDGRVLLPDGDTRYLRAAENTYCATAKESFSWRRRTQGEAATDCAQGARPALFTMLMQLPALTRYRLEVNPDRTQRGPQESFAPTAAELAPKQRITELLPLDVAGREHQQTFRSLVQHANSAPNPPRVLVCTYHDKGWSFWYASPPQNLDEFIRLDAAHGSGLAALGTSALRECPRDEAEARRVEAGNREQWRKAVTQARR